MEPDISNNISSFADVIRDDLRRRYQSEFQQLEERYNAVLLNTSYLHLRAITDKINYYDGLMVAYTQEIERLIQIINDQNSITTVKEVIDQNANDLRNELDKIERLAMGEAVDSSFVFSDLSDDDDDDEGDILGNSRDI